MTILFFILVVPAALYLTAFLLYCVLLGISTLAHRIRAARGVKHRGKFRLAPRDMGGFPAQVVGVLAWVVPPNFAEFGMASWRLQNEAILWDGQIFRKYRRGKVFDGESVPAVFTWYESRDSSLSAALAHDDGYLYHKTEAWSEIANRWEWMPVDKIATDNLFRAVRLLDHPDQPKHAFTAWFAVLCFGWSAWATGVCNAGTPGKGCVPCPDDVTNNAGQQSTPNWCPFVIASNRPPIWGSK